MLGFADGGVIEWWIGGGWRVKVESGVGWGECLASCNLGMKGKVRGGFRFCYVFWKERKEKKKKKRPNDVVLV